RPSTQLPSAVGVAFKPSVGVSFFFVAPAATVICTLSLHDALPISWIITNPPFKDSVAFINRAIQIGKPFAYLLKSQYWHARNKRSEEHTSELQSREKLVCRLLLEKKKN